MLLVAPERHMLHLRTPHRAAPGGNARASRLPKPPISPPLTVQAPKSASSSTRGSGGAPNGAASSWECRAAQSRQARPEEA